MSSFNFNPNLGGLQYDIMPAPPSYGNQGDYGQSSAASQPFGQYYDLVQGASQPSQTAPPGWNYNAGTGMYQTTWGGSTANPFGAVTVQSSSPGGTTPPGMAQYQGAALGDYMNLVGANQQNYQNFMEAAGGFRDSVMSGAESIRAGGQEGQQQLFDYAAGLSQQGEDIYKKIEGRVDEAIEGYQDLSAAQASSISAGLLAQNKSQRAQMSAGAKMGDPNAIAALQQFELDNDMKQAQTMTQLATSYNQGLAGMRMQGAQTLIGAAGVQANYDQMASGMTQMGVSIAQSAIAQAANFEAQGLSSYAQMIAANPFNPVAFLPTLMSFFQFTETPGSESFAGFGSDFLVA